MKTLVTLYVTSRTSDNESLGKLSSHEDTRCRYIFSRIHKLFYKMMTVGVCECIYTNILILTAKGKEEGNKGIIDKIKLRIAK